MTDKWRYTVSVPSWSLTQLRDDDPVVFYSIEVRFLPPEGTAQTSRKHNVLRRFSHFQKLYLRLKELHGSATLSSMKLPPKLVLTKVSKHPELIDRRRGDLEQWLWRVVANAELARSPLVMSFLDLSEAVRVIPHAAPAASSPDKSAAVSQSSTEEELSESLLQQAHIIAQQNHTAGAHQHQMRLGFRIEQRTLLKKHVQQLRRHLDEIESDLRGAAAIASA